MRQWDLIGITDNAPAASLSARDEKRYINLDRLFSQVSEPSVFFWTTDAALRLATLTDAAAELLQCSPASVRGRDLLEVIGPGGESLTILEAHVSALQGETATFHVRSRGQNVMCRVAPIRDMSARVIGTFCYAASRRRESDDASIEQPKRIPKRKPKRVPDLEVA